MYPLKQQINFATFTIRKRYDCWVYGPKYWHRKGTHSTYKLEVDTWAFFAYMRSSLKSAQGSTEHFNENSAKNELSKKQLSEISRTSCELVSSLVQIINQTDPRKKIMTIETIPSSCFDKKNKNRQKLNKRRSQRGVEMNDRIYVVFEWRSPVRRTQGSILLFDFLIYIFFYN